MWTALEYGAPRSYLVGTVLCLFGSVFFLSFTALTTSLRGASLFEACLFFAGSVINVLLIVKADNLVTLQLMHLTARTFVVGSVLFTVASVPYLWDARSEADQRTTDSFLAWLFLAGSVLFLPEVCLTTGGPTGLSQNR